MSAGNLALHPESCLALHHDRLMLSKWLHPFLHDVHTSVADAGMLAQGLACFNLLRDKACCPECDSEIQPVTCAFIGCAWALMGSYSAAALTGRYMPLNPLQPCWL